MNQALPEVDRRLVEQFQVEYTFPFIYIDTNKICAAKHLNL